MMFRILVWLIIEHSQDTSGENVGAGLRGGRAVPTLHLSLPPTARFLPGVSALAAAGTDCTPNKAGPG